MGELINWERKDRGAMREGLDSIQDLLTLLHHPERAFRPVHVAGSKGKGSTSALIDAGLRAAGLRTGCYASPHVSRVTERVRIDGREVPEGDLARALDEALAARERGLAEGRAAGRATWFDLMTAAAFRLFEEARVEWAVVEVGLGGRLDSTNVIDGEVCVVTHVDLEHTNVLGPTRAVIAGEKAGILKAGAPVACGVTTVDPADDPLAVVEARARELGCAFHRAAWEPTFAGRNRALAGLALNLVGELGVVGADGEPVGERLLTEDVVRGARLPGRMETFVLGGTTVVVDGAHVASSVTGVLDELERERPGAGPPCVVLALGRDKEVGAVLKALAGRVDRVLCTTVETGPLLASEDLAGETRALGIPAREVPDPGAALTQALEAAADGGWVLVIGSLYLAGAVRERILCDPDLGPGGPRCSPSSPTCS